MALPTKDQICKAVENSGNILDPRLRGFNTIEGIIGAECYSGGFCIVYPVTNGSQKYAFRVWHTEIDGIKDRLKKISAYLASIQLPYFVEFDYVDGALRVIDEDGKIQDIDAVRMEWVEGKNLVQYLDSIISESSFSEDEKKSRIRALADKFLTMVTELHQKKIAHGDLQHGNIIVSANEEIRLVDYDSLYVPTLINEDQVTSGLAAYQHPARRSSAMKCSEQDDYFSEHIIYMSLLAFSLDLGMWEPIESRDEHSLLLNDRDILEISQGQTNVVFDKLNAINDPNLQILLAEIRKNLSSPTLGQIQPLETLLSSLTSSRDKYKAPPSNGAVTLEDGEFDWAQAPKKPTYGKQEITTNYDENAARQKYAKNS